MNKKNYTTRGRERQEEAARTSTQVLGGALFNYTLDATTKK
jgi:hypothetical protein